MNSDNSYLEKPFFNYVEGICFDHKLENPTTSQEKANKKQNQPMFFQGIFWNVNKNLPEPEKNSSFIQLDRKFEGELLREHIAAIKISIKTYLSSLGEENFFLQQDYKSQSEFTINEQELLKQPERGIKNFINYMRDSKILNQFQANNLSLMLKQNPLALRLFQIYVQIAPVCLKQKLVCLIYKGLLMNEDLKKSNIEINQGLFKFLQNNFKQLLDNTLLNQQQNQRKLSLVVLYTVIISLNGKAVNAFYQNNKSQYNYHKFTLTNFEKSMNLISKQKSKKKTVYLRRSLVFNIQKVGNSKKRHLSNDQ